MSTPTIPTPRSGHLLTGALVALTLALPACASSSAGTAPPPASAAEQAEPAAAAPPSADPDVLATATDGDVTFSLTDFGCTPIAGTADGEPIESMGRACTARLEIVNGSASDLQMTADQYVLTTAAAVEVTASPDSGLALQTPVIPAGETLTGRVSWGPIEYHDRATELRVHAVEDSSGAVMSVEDDG